ncbi:MAG: phosphatidate cytidylyltransferase [Planctomycetaceae bacterium]|jgi:phosphatidate cytidylyltransferase
MLGWRLLMSAILIPLVCVLFRLDLQLGPPAWILCALCLLIATRSAWELTDLLKTRAFQPCFPLIGILSNLVILAAWLPALLQPGQTPALTASLTGIAAAVTASFLILLAWEAWRFQEPGRSMEALGGGLLSVLYAGALLAVTAQLRWYPAADNGYFALASMIICVKSGDTCAYTFGRLWGKRKMAPRLSPGKTWMGLVGAVFGSIAGTWLWLTFAGQLFRNSPQPASLPVVVLYGLTTGLAGLIGDLVESLIKRDVGKKDSAALMPGFGGLLDLVDSPLYAGPVALAWWTLLPPAC